MQKVGLYVDYSMFRTFLQAAIFYVRKCHKMQNGFKTVVKNDLTWYNSFKLKTT